MTIDRGEFDQLRSPGALTGHSLDPDSWTEGVFTHHIWADKDVIAVLFKVLAGLPQEAESFRGHFQETIDLDGFSGKFKRFAFPLFATTWAVASHSSLFLPVSLTSITLVSVSVAVSIAAPVVTASTVIATIGVIGGVVLATGRGVRRIGVWRNHTIN